MKRKLRSVGGTFGRVGNTVFVGEGWTREKIQKVLDTDWGAVKEMAVATDLAQAPPERKAARSLGATES